MCLVTACSSLAPPTDMAGASQEELVARMGAPETERTVADGGRLLEFPTGPYGKKTWFVTLDAAGRVVRAEQVLTESNFLRINPGMSQQDVHNILGRPGQVQPLGRGRGMIWQYRYENPFCQWFQIEIATDQTVRSAGYGEPPECDRPNEIIVPN